MIVKLGENKSQIVSNETVDGVTVDIYMYAAAANTAFISSAFVPSEVQVKVELKRKKGNMAIVTDNLQLLGAFSAQNYGNKDWFVGNVLTAAASGVKEDKLYSLYIPFGGPINLKGEDQLVISFIVGRGVWSAAVDSSISYVDFNYNTCIGYEVATPQIRSQVVQANINNEKYSLGDRVTKIMFLNFDKTAISNAQQVVSSLSLVSDKLNQTMNFYQLWNKNKNYFTGPQIWLDTAQTGALLTAAQPQSFVIFASPDTVKNNLSNTQINVSYNSSNVNASQNYIAWITFYQDTEILQKAIDTAAKHATENLQAVPVATPTA